jgi:hypothetical protein
LRRRSYPRDPRSEVTDGKRGRISLSDRKGLWWQKFYPTEGDSAVAEMWAGEQMWADLHLEGIQLDRRGDERVQGIREVLTLFSPTAASQFAPKGAWTLDAAEVLRQLQEARSWLLENEKERAPEQE